MGFSTDFSVSFPATLSRHVSHIFTSFAIYSLVACVLLPRLSSRLFRRHYSSLNDRMQIKWDLRAASLCHSCFVTSAALYVLITDQERNGLQTYEERTRTYLWKVGVLQSIMLGHGLWEFSAMMRFPWAFVPGSLAHVFFTGVVWFMAFVRTWLPT